VGGGSASGGETSEKRAPAGAGRGEQSAYIGGREERGACIENSNKSLIEGIYPPAAGDARRV